MITANDLRGIMAMMPAFTAKDGDHPHAEDTTNIGVMECWSIGVLAQMQNSQAGRWNKNFQGITQ